MDYQRHIIIVNDTPSQTNMKKDAYNFKKSAVKNGRV